MSAELRPSKLGTKEHWDKVYAEEVANFDEIGDEGEVWFGIESVDKMVDWCSEHAPSSVKPYILEVGCGNGTLLFALLEAGYEPSTLSGIDYSSDAVKLAQRVGLTRQGGEDVSFSVCDFLADTPPAITSMGDKDSTGLWDVVLDKGTFDAIALGVKDEAGFSPASKYPQRLARLLKPGGFFLITSCNFTEDELKLHFHTPESCLRHHSRVQHPTFSFGGRSGSICATVAFQRTE